MNDPYGHIDRDGWNSGFESLWVRQARPYAGGLFFAFILKITLVPVLIIIAVVLMLGSALYLALNIKNDIQLWLMSCLWRKIPPGDGAIPEIWPTSAIELEELSTALESGEY
ncbi:hypothetical protein [Erwinia sorbitola]|uniref:DUF3742 family protein n=1 Tax=Erwinia sorbitola TaxID=2681984 RepID=A0A6I6F5M7_9GAMM|nr:hypothetical protein [Erwinia sorbitola]QGU89190.1 hypothetical protein GN242_19060 [Erwinia sorbitola]